MSGTRSSICPFSLVCVALGLLAVVSGSASGSLVVTIIPAGPSTFQEGDTVSGQITWSVDEDFTIGTTSPLTRFQFDVNLSALDLDNMPAGQSLSDVTLVGWPESYGTTLAWEHYFASSSSTDGPVNSWRWGTQFDCDIPISFEAGQTIATATWSFSGTDADGLADTSGFAMMADARKMVWVAQGGTGSLATSMLGSDTTTFNPEPIPEPASLSLLALGGLAMLRRFRK